MALLRLREGIERNLWTGVCESDKIVAVRDVSSINLRIAGEHFGVADEIISKNFIQMDLKA